MAESKTMRLSKVAKELNVGIDRIADRLSSKGIEVDARPNSKISGEVYEILLQEFSSDQDQKLRSARVAKEKRQEKEALRAEQKQKEDDALQAQLEAEKKAKAEEEALAEENRKKEAELAKALKAEMEKKRLDAEKEAAVIRAKAVVSGPKTVGKIDIDKSENPVEKTEAKEKATEEQPAEATPIAKKEAPVKEETPQDEESQDPLIRAKAKPLEGIKTKGKIDLRTVSNNRKAKGEKPAAPKTKPAAKAKAPVKAKEEVKAKPVAKQEAPVKTTTEAPAETTEESKPGVVRAQSERLAGPKFTGKKIDLSQFNKPKKKKVASSSAPSDPKKAADTKKRKRKRIVKDGNTPGNNQNAGNRTGAGAGAGNRKGRVKPGANRRPAVVAKAEPTEAEIQKKISDTLSRLTNKGKSKGSKHRRSKRDGRREQEVKDLIRKEEENKTIKVTEFVTVSELATMMSVAVTDVISTCMMLGIMVTMNQRLDAETLTIVAEEFGYEVEFVSAEVQDAIEEEEEDREEDYVARAPIVTVMGHVDHGKTSLLDYVRKANVISGEAGGITQHIGAYEVKLSSGKSITFIDTPGHEAFTAMRARGAKVTDVVIVVIAADDEVMPQTKEAISHAQAAEVPIVFAINKVDKPNANPDKIKEQLAAMNLLVEDWGGKYQSHDVSAKTGMGVEDLLEKVLLEAELLNLTANPKKRATGTIIEASLDKGKGYVTTMLVQTGTMRIGDFILAGRYTGKVKAMHDERGNALKEAGPSVPVSLLGLNGAPQAGDNFNSMGDEREAKSIANKRMQLQREQSIRTQKHITLDEIGRRLAVGDFKELNIILKGDVDGSIEALSDSLQKLSTDSIQVNIIHKAVGQVTESDVLLASASDAIIIGFQVRPSASARKIAEKEEIDIRMYSIIYDAINEVRDAMEGMLAPTFKEEIVCNVEIREVFKISKVGTVAGCYVLDGKISRNTDVRVIRDGIVIYSGALGSLKRFKDDVKEVAKGYECGLNIDKFNDLKVGDLIEGYEQVEVQRKL